MKTNESAPLLRLFKLSITAAQRENFVAAGRHNLGTSIKNEAGTLAMYATHVDPVGLENRVIEVYRDAASYAIHAQSPQFKAFRAVAKEAVTQQAVLNLTPVVLWTGQPLGADQLANPLVQLTEITVLPGKMADYRSLVLATMAAQPGLLALVVGYAVDAPEKWVILTVYRDQLADQRYRQPAAFRKYQLASQSLIQTTKTTVLGADTLVNQGGLAFRG